MLPLTFGDAADYDKVREDDRVSIIGLTAFAPGVPLKMTLQHSDGTVNECLLHHTFNENQIQWFKAGGALNLIAGRTRVKGTQPKRIRKVLRVKKEVGSKRRTPVRKVNRSGRKSMKGNLRKRK
jgi:hypothetical protein